jgi:F0F1-type ATP synthase membrane subunit a
MDEAFGNPKMAYGIKKPSIHFIPMWIILVLAVVFALGARKYGLRNWRKEPVRASTYYDAAFRHATDWFEELIENDAESGVHHLAHAIAGFMIIMDAQRQGTLIDDRNNAEVIRK